MKHGRKMKLVDADHTFDNIQSTNTNESRKKVVSSLDSKINNILQLKNISTEKKAKLYNIELQRYLFFMKQNRQPNELKFLLENDDIVNRNEVKNEEEESTEIEPEYNDSIYDDIDRSYDFDEFDMRQPKMSTPYKEQPTVKINNSNPFITPEHLTFQNDEISKNGHISMSPIKNINMRDDTNPFHVKSKLKRSPVLTRQLVNSSLSAAKKFKNWISLSKQKK